ncbi:hypothetical protein [Chitinophaga rhizosphaerae]|uniref:hypothetical protein n=1 Tax=Chitinophaga rhizosphaerae TaxID=1864947 RepID=UPI000F7FE617|nr:hypothetical protein [Chitinophaga rhizosphaerae]
MKKVNFCLLFAFIIIAMTAFSSKSEFRTITACFPVVVLQNIPGTSLYVPAQTDAAATANSLIFGASQIKYLRHLPSGDGDDCFGTSQFCCVRFTEAPASTPSTVPILNIGGILARWVVTSVEFHD